MSQLVENGGSDFAQQIPLVATDRLHILLEHVDNIWQCPRIQNTALGHCSADIQAQDQFIFSQSQFLELFPRRPILHLHRHLLEVRGKRRWQSSQRFLHESSKRLEDSWRKRW